MTPIPPGIQEWHDRFAASVRVRDIAQGLALFAPQVRAFGTVVEYAPDLRCLQQEQWMRVWPHTRGFHFLPSPVEVFLSADASQACVLTFWESDGLREDGTPFPRRGRCTTVLHQEPSAPCGWLAVHTHYSKRPAGDV